MLTEVYKKIDQSVEKRKKANKINNEADELETSACNIFNKVIQVKHIEELCEVIDNKGFEGEKEEIHNILEKKQYNDLSIEDLKKYRFLEDKYGENLDYNKSRTFLDRFIGNLRED